MSVSPTDLKQGRINDDLGTKLESISAQVEANVERGRNAVAEWRTALSEKGAHCAKKMDRYTHDHPWRIVSSAFVGGLLLGLLCGCESSSRRTRI